MGVATHIVTETVEGGGESEKWKEEVEEIGSLVVEALLLMDHSSDGTMTPFKVGTPFVMGGKGEGGGAVPQLK